MLLFLPLLLPGALPLPLLIVFPAPVPLCAVSFLSFVPLFVSSSLSLLFSSFFYSCPPFSSFTSSIFFIDFFLTISLFFILFLFEVSSSLSRSNDEAEIGETFEDGFKRRLTVYLSVLRL